MSVVLVHLITSLEAANNRQRSLNFTNCWGIKRNANLWHMAVLRDLTQKKCIVWVEHFKVTNETNGSNGFVKNQCLVDEISGMTYVSIAMQTFQGCGHDTVIFCGGFF